MTNPLGRWRLARKGGRIGPAIHPFVRRALGTASLVIACVGPHSLENATANGDTRTIYLHHSHTGEDITATFRKDGVYDRAVLAQLNHFLRDWRNDDETNMDPRLFDIVWEAYRESGSRQPIWIVSAYRSPVTNAMLRRRSKAVAEHSQHMLGKAMDMHYMDVPMSRIREIGMRLQRGGVGYYPSSGTPFVHMDVGSVRYWPRMSYDSLARLFPDGKAVFLAADGRTLPRYEEARAEIEARGGQGGFAVADAGGGSGKNFFSKLFGLGKGDEDDSEEPVARTPARGKRQVASLGTATGIGPASSEEAAPAADRAQTVAAAAQSNLPRGETFAGPAAPLPPRRPAELNAPVAVASLQQTQPPVQSQPSVPAAASVPVPPSRPVALPTSNLSTSNLPTVITHGSSAPGVTAAASTPETTLAYAAEDRGLARVVSPRLTAAPSLGRTIGLRAAMDQRKSHLVAARVDPTTFSQFIAPVSFRAGVSSVTFAATVLPLRAAARLDAVAVAFAPTASTNQGLTTYLDLPRADRFAGVDGFSGANGLRLAQN